MSDPPPGDISLVLPTYNRAAALRENLPSMIAVEGVKEIIVVDDGSTDDTVEVCTSLREDRLRVISHPRNLGVAGARNTGVEAAHGNWVLFGEDDCRFPPEYAIVLCAEAERHRADIVGAPMLHDGEGTDLSVAERAASMPRVRTAPSLDGVALFVAEPVETPFLCALALVRKPVFERVRFYEGYPVNGFREETDFFVQAARAGFRCLLTSATYSYQLSRWEGGQHHAPKPRYEYWVLRNNWHFLRRHGEWLAERGHIAGPLRAQLHFTTRRARKIASGYLRGRLRRVRAATSRPASASSSA
jgi:glycosyltransferase involved in cell wall biosynthesis